jgi:hypothetical protein
MRSKRRMPAEYRSGAELSGSSHKECLLVQESVWRAVDKAAENGVAIAVPRMADEIGNAFPASGLSASAIADALVYAAVDAGVLVERQAPRMQPMRLSRLPRLSFSAFRDVAAGRSPPQTAELRPQA